MMPKLQPLKLLPTSAVIFMLAGGVPPLSAAQSVDALLSEAIAGTHRDPGNSERDGYRHPRETLLFFGLQPDMTVVEIAPGSGWYTEILGPVLRDEGKLYVASLASAGREPPPYLAEMKQKYLAKIQSNTEVYGDITPVDAILPTDRDIVAPGSADLVLTFRNVHNWVQAGSDAAAFDAFFRALKPGGTLGVVEHRALPGASLDTMKTSGYVTEARVIELAQTAGFVLDARSEINANPKDGTLHPKGVWTLPPRLRLGDQDREKYLAIGESDRMTLRFVKPAR